jgi:hypothetical protein
VCWRLFLKQHAASIWACDFFCVETILFRTLCVFLVIDHASRQVLHVHVTPHPTADWSQQIVKCCGWDWEPPGFLVHDRDSCYGTNFDRRVRHLGITQARTPFRWPRAKVRSVRTECLDQVFTFNERSTAGAHTVRLDNGHPARRCHLRRIDTPKLERSSQYPCSGASITSISGPHDRRIQFLRRSVLRDADSSRASGRRRKWSPRPSCVGRCGVDRDQRNASSRWNKKTPRVRSVGRS